MKKGDVIRQKCVNTTFYLTGILAHKVNNIISLIFLDVKFNFLWSAGSAIKNKLDCKSISTLSVHFLGNSGKADSEGR